MSIAQQVQRYDIDDPYNQIWWDEVAGRNDIEAIKEILGETNADFVFGKQEELIPQEYALEKSELEEIETVVEEEYPGSFEQFIDEAAVSTLHPQQSKQLERYAENIKPPTRFDTYDGFPLPE